ncbi:hypothetical protein E2C01_032723 [Portunus trituberculatus]|uniref:Uncharacterized protein n=1 Tax=Portunus trituberculatus TaxID=210409 RepID=A0A5B7F154_PORTR|nr:hypothetical protein [Portunus trituberculatus]
MAILCFCLEQAPPHRQPKGGTLQCHNSPSEVVLVGSPGEYVGRAVQLPPISGTGNFIYSGTHIRAHITTQGHLGCNHLEFGYHGDM